MINQKLLTEVLANNVTSKELLGFVEKAVEDIKDNSLFAKTIYENKLLTDMIGMLCSKLESVHKQNTHTTREDINYDYILDRCEQTGNLTLFNNAMEDYMETRSTETGISKTIDLLLSDNYIALEKIFGIDQSWYKMRYILALLSLNEKSK